MRCAGGGREEKGGKGEDRIKGGAGVAVPENDGSTGKRQRTTMSPYKMWRMRGARRGSGKEETGMERRTMTIMYIITRNVATGRVGVAFFLERG